MAILFFGHLTIENVPAYHSPNEQTASEDAEQKHGIDVGEVFGGVHHVLVFGFIGFGRGAGIEPATFGFGDQRSTN